MGSIDCCCPPRKKNPIIIAYYDLNDLEQKNYIQKFKKHIQNKFSVYELENNKFSIFLSFPGKNYLIKEDNDFNPSNIPKYIEYIDNIIKQSKDEPISPISPFPTKKVSTLDPVINITPKEKGNFYSKDNIQNRVKNKAINTNDNEKINILLEDMLIYGNIMKNEIKENKYNRLDKFIEIKDALKMEKKDQGIFALGLLAHILEINGTKVAIEKDNNEEETDVGTTCLQFITNGLGYKTSYDLHFDFGSRKNLKLLNDNYEYERLKDQIKTKLSKDYNISKNKIIVTNRQIGSFIVQVIFQSDEFNYLNLEELTEKFKNDKDFPILQNLKYIQQDVVLTACKLSKGQLDSKGNRSDGWGVNEFRGNRPYYPPKGWKGIGLRVIDKYDNKDNTWIGMDNIKGEWCVAYLAIGRDSNDKNIRKNLAHKNCPDQDNPGRKVGEGVYCSPLVDIAESNSRVTRINQKNYKIVLMVRVKPDAIRSCKDRENIWVVNGTTDEIRPYRILYKEIKYDY